LIAEGKIIENKRGKTTPHCFGFKKRGKAVGVFGKKTSVTNPPTQSFLVKRLISGKFPMQKCSG
jgi:hypothetical protein